MYLDTLKKNECCGCSACQQICPAQCIKMERDEEGFLYPILFAPAQCVHCDKCRKVCSFQKTEQTTNKPTCFYGWHSDPEIRQRSTSGAAFVGLVQACKQNGYTHVYGAVMDEKCTVFHKGQSTLDDLEPFKGSKYVQSDMGNCFSEIKKIISEGGKVIFSGTPCQISGLQAYLGRESRKGLFTIALICHGVASPAALNTYLRQLAEKKGSNVKGFRFRSKDSTCPIVCYESGTSEPAPNDCFMQVYNTGAITRESCFVCPYATAFREADVSIGDFWGAEKWNSELSKEIKNGISLILGHTVFGREMLECSKAYMNLWEVPLEVACNDRQPNLSHPIERTFLRNYFLRHCLSSGKNFESDTKKLILAWKVRRKIKIMLNQKDF